MRKTCTLSFIKLSAILLVLSLAYACGPSQTRLYVRLDSIDGLDSTLKIRSRGVSIGNISRIDFNGNQKVLVEVTLNEDIKVPKNSQFYLKYTNILGSKVLSVDFSNNSEFYEDEDTINGITAARYGLSLDTLARRIISDSMYYPLVKVIGKVLKEADTTDNYNPEGEPEFILTNGQLKLSERIRITLSNYDPDFKIWKKSDFVKEAYNNAGNKPDGKQSPFAVIGDFNGDAIPDIALMGHNNINDLLLVVLSNKNAYHVLEITKEPLSDPSQELQSGYGPGLWVYLRYVGPGKISSPVERRSLQLTTDAFELVYAGKASQIIYFKNGSFLRYSTFD